MKEKIAIIPFWLLLARVFDETENKLLNLNVQFQIQEA
jgi:hypothetical protein